MTLIKYTDVARNTRGDSLPDYRLQVVTSAGAGVDIYSDGAGTRFRDGSGNVVNYATANSAGKVDFYWEPATGQILQVLDASGTLVDTDADFADKYVIANLAGEVPQASVTDLEDDLAAKAASVDLSSNESGKGRDLIGEPTIAQMLASSASSRGEGAKWHAGGFRYTEAASGASDHDLTTAGGVKLYVDPVADGVWNIQAFGAVGDYDADTETPGAVASSATDNYDAINAARLAFENRLLRGKLVFPAPGDYWASNMPRFRLSNFTIKVEQGATIRTTTPTSFGTTIYLGDDDTENVLICGGGEVRNFLPDPDDYAAWAASTVYAPATYIKNSSGHVYWTELGGTSGATEPTGLAAPQDDGGVIWRDALNDNGISLHGNNARCIGMRVPEANNKGITCQLPPWENVWITDNIVGSTFFAGIEIKGNQGLSGQESLFGKQAWVCRNVVKDAGGHGIHAEQPSLGGTVLYRNRDFTISDNIVERAGYREGEGHGYRINRCIGVNFRGNRVMDTEGNGVYIRQCFDVEGDVFVSGFGIHGFALEDCADCTFSTVTIKSDGTATGEAIRENSCDGRINYGRIKIEGGDYTYAFRSLAKNSISTCESFDAEDGTTGRILNSPPNLYTPRLVAVKQGSAAGLSLNATITPLAWDATPLYDSGDFSVSSGEVTIPAGVDVVAIEGTLATGNVGEVRVYVELDEGSGFNLIAFADGEGTGGEGATASVDLLPVSEGDVLRMAGSISTGTTTSTAVYDQFTVRVVAGDILTQAT